MKPEKIIKLIASALELYSQEDLDCPLKGYKTWKGDAPGLTLIFKNGEQHNITLEK